MLTVSHEMTFVPKTVKTVKKNRYGRGGGVGECDDISPLEDDECRISFRNRLEGVDAAVDDDTACSPIQRKATKSFDFVQNPIAVDLFGKENMESGMEDDDTIDDAVAASHYTLGRKMILPPCEPISPCPVLDEIEGTYLPVCDAFREDDNGKHNDCTFEGWVSDVGVLYCIVILPTIYSRTNTYLVAHYNTNPSNYRLHFQRRKDF